MNINLKKKLKILFVSDVSISDVIGGAERMLYEQSTRLAERGHRVHILTRRLGQHKEYKEVRKGATEWRYQYNPKNQVLFFLTSLKNARNLFEKIHDTYKFDCINFHQPFSALGVLSSPMSSSLKKIYTCHSLSFEEYLTRNINGGGILRKISLFLPAEIRKFIEKYSLNKCQKITVLSKFTKNKLVDSHHIPGEKIIKIPGGVDIKKFYPKDSKSAIRKELKIPNDKVILFTVRNLVRRMGLENLIIAFHSLVKEINDLELVIGGQGPLQNGLIVLTRSFGIEKKVHLTGFISDEKLPLYYQMADLFVLPSKELEGFGLVTLEAMASGLPVLGTPVGGTREIIGNLDPAFLFKGTDPHSIAGLILEKYNVLKQNPQKWKEISTRCRNFVERNYSWEKNIDALEELFTQTAQNYHSFS